MKTFSVQYSVFGMSVTSKLKTVDVPFEFHSVTIPINNNLLHPGKIKTKAYITGYY